MHLFLSSSVPWRSDYCTEDGRVVYQVDSPRYTWGAKEITITTLEPQSNTFSFLAMIEYHTESLFGGDSTFKIGESVLPAREVLPKDGFSIFGFGSRMFVGPDGQNYRWTMDNTKCRLFKKDANETPIATFHREHLGILSAARPASLEVFPLGEHMVDYIVITFIYMEKLRQEKQARRRRNNMNNMNRP